MRASRKTFCISTVAILTSAFFIVSIRVNLIFYVHDSIK